MQLIIFQRIFSHYRKPFYDLLSKEFHLLLLHGHDKSGIKGEKAAYSKLIRQISIWGDRATIYFDKNLFINDSKVVVIDFAIQILTLPVFVLSLKLLKKKVLLWSHGYDRKKGFWPNKNMGDYYRKLLMQMSDGVLVYSELDKAYLKSKGLRIPIYVVPNTLDSRAIQVVKDKLIGVEIDTNTNKLIFIGRMISSKQPSLLIKMFNLLPKLIKTNTSIHFIGEGPETTLCRQSAHHGNYSDHFVFHGSIYDEYEIGKIMTNAKLVIIPGEVGLSVNHSLLYGVPVVAFRKNEKGPFHGPEEVHIIDRKTGFLIENGDVAALAETVSSYLSNPELQKFMKNEIGDYCKKHLLISNMVSAMTNIIRTTVYSK